MKKWIIIAAICVLALIIGANCFFILEEGESAIMQRFGRIHAIYVKTATPELRAQMEADGESIPIHEGTGIKLKVPFLDNPIKYSSKLISYDTPPREVITSDKRTLYFDNSAQWRIDNPLRFYKAYNNMQNAETRIDDILYSRMNERVGQMLSHILITDKAVVGDMLIELSGTVSSDCQSFGVSVIDVRIKRTDLPSGTYESIYNRMNTERQKIAAQHRSEGDETSIRIRSETDREVISITSEAKRDAEIIKGEGDGEAARIFNEAYGSDPEFFEFYNLLETYKTTIGKSSTMVIPLDSPFAKYLLGVSADPAAPAVSDALPSLP